MKTAIQFGAGNIGRGFMGQLFFEAGYHTIFVEASKSLVDLLNASHTYPLRLLDAATQRTINMDIAHIQALHIDQIDQITDAIAHTEVMGSAVGVPNLIHIAPLLVAGIHRRFTMNPAPIDIYLCENMLHAASQLKSHVLEQLEHDVRVWAEDYVGFVGTSVARMVPVISEELRRQHPGLVVADSYHKLPYDGIARKAAPPRIEGLYPVRNFEAEVERKLFMYNLGHAALAYPGYLKGLSYIHESFEDQEITMLFQKCLDETALALQKRFPEDIDAKSQEETRKDIFLRFSNPMIMDTIRRIARDPIRKLGSEDRLIGSANLCLNQGIFPKYIAIACAAALCYDQPEDPQAVKLQEIIRHSGIEATLRNVSSLDPESEFGKTIIHNYLRIQEQRANAEKHFSLLNE
jgi:mannitol-1-phosphate 5-dehydrogenase